MINTEVHIEPTKVYNGYTLLGDGTRVNKSTAIQVSELSSITKITAGYVHSIALLSNGTVKAWGYNGYGQLGDGSTTTRTTPVQVSGLINITAITGGYFHSLALKNDSTVWAWGDNYCGQLGNGTSNNNSTPVQVSGLSNISSISCGYSYSQALKNDNTVWAWGDNHYGQLGNGEKVSSDYAKWVFGTPSLDPVMVPCTIACIANKPFNLVIKTQNSKCFTGRVLTLTYNTNQISSVVDLCRMTYHKETATGVIVGTGITIVQNDPGIIKFSINYPIDIMESWSGIINVITLNPSISGEINLVCRLE